MSKNYYKLYIDSVIALAQTLSIKSEQSAYAVNTYISAMYGPDLVNEADKSSWKYYRNICGEYHSTDSVIYITSLDTLETIPFTKTSMVVHRATARAYRFGTRYYRELITLYPEKEQLILGILYPADMAYALDAKDGAILSYPAELVEENEESLIKNIESWIQGFKYRWDNTQFGVSDTLYSASLHGVMYLNLVPTILNIRQSACKTNEAHSFHVREYLASHGMLDAYLESMTIKQALFFYRNINYIERNNGKKAIFSWLVDRVMTERALPLAEYTMRHDVSAMPDTLYAKPTFRKKLLNLQDTVQREEVASLSALLDKEEPLNVGNPDYRSFEEGRINRTMELSLSSVVATKVLESSVTQYVDGPGESLESILLNHWLFLGHKGLYNVFVRAKNPRTGEDMVLNALDAFVYATYAFCKSIDIDLVDVPVLRAERVQRIPTPTVEDILSIDDTKYAPRDIAEWIISVQPTVGSQDSTESFYNKCKEIRTATRIQAGIVSYQEHQYRRGLTHGMVSRMYSDEVCNVAPAGTKMVDWMASRDLPTTDFTNEEYLAIYKEFLADATGVNLTDTQSLGSIQRAMVNLMRQLSSYSVQYITELNGSDVKALKWSMIRVGDVTNREANLVGVYGLHVTVLKAIAKVFDKMIFEILGNGFNEKVHVVKTDRADLEIVVQPHFGDGSTEHKFQIHLGAFTINGCEPQGPHKTLSGYETFYELTEEEKAKVMDIYCQCFPEKTDRKVNLNDLLLNNYLNVFQYHGIKNDQLNGFEYVDIPYFSGGPFTTTTADVDLDAFYNNFGQADLNAFISNHPKATLDAFKFQALPHELDGLENNANNSAPFQD